MTNDHLYIFFYLWLGVWETHMSSILVEAIHIWHIYDTFILHYDVYQEGQVLLSIWQVYSLYPCASQFNMFFCVDTYHRDKMMLIFLSMAIETLMKFTQIWICWCTVVFTVAIINLNMVIELETFTVHLINFFVHSINFILCNFMFIKLFLL